MEAEPQRRWFYSSGTNAGRGGLFSGGEQSKEMH